MAVRILLVSIALAAGAYALSRHGDLRDCQHARQTMFNIGVLGTGPAAPSAADVARAAADLRRICRDADADVAGVQALLVARHPVPALGLARDATRRQPQDAVSWNALAQAADAAGDPALARAARAHAHRLSPFR